MGLWLSILFMFSCAVSGLLIGMLLIHMLRRKKEVFPNTKDSEISIATTVGKGMTKSNGHESPLEIQIKNNKNSIIAENPKQPSATNLTSGNENIILKNASKIEKEEKTTQAVINRTKLMTPSDRWTREKTQKPHELPAVEEPLAANQKNPLMEGELKKIVVPNVLRESENTNQEAALGEEKQKEVSKAFVQKKSDTLDRNNMLDVNTKKNETKPLLQKPDNIKQESEPVMEKYHEFKESKLPEAENVEEKIIPILEIQKSTLKSELVAEVEINLAIASHPWADKLISFQTKCWDSQHGGLDSLFQAHHQELIQIYVDIGLANNIVWLATEIGHRTKELDESYIKLCSVIADNIKILIS